ncbi:hypothetical protein AB0O07_27010 [Streptomyces sp. NPDC093085]|uniref:hypothetical protein n=1 Tax=Streptomyces sp. NPDC093085 TaxID=3155068 RepID=UPI00343261E9
MPRIRSVRATSARSAAALLCATSLVLLATGCREDDMGPDAAASGQPTADASADASADPAGDGGDGGSGGNGGGSGQADADLGKTLALGDSTVLTYKRSNKELELQVTTKSVKKGSQSDLDNLKLDAKERELQPYYVTVDFKNVGKKTADYPFLTTPVGLRDARGEQGKTLITIGGEIAGCEGKDPDHFAPDDTSTQCKVFLLPKDQDPSVVLYNGDFDKEPVYWKAS